MSAVLSSSLPARDKALDLIKWLALLTMLIDHLRHVWPSLYFLYAPGRLAFPLFCLAVAANVARPRPATADSPSASYLGWLLLFALLSEWPYRLLVPTAESLNVLPTLILGLLLANALQRPSRRNACLGGAALLVGLLARDELMFGLFGVLLPATFLLAMRRPGVTWLLPMLCCLAANYWAPFYRDAAHGDPFAWSVILTCLLAPVVGLSLLRLCGTLPIPPVRRWAYLFYPGHFLLLVAISAI